MLMGGGAALNRRGAEKQGERRKAKGESVG
jgi:hypothetical protein